MSRHIARLLLPTLLLSAHALAQSPATAPSTAQRTLRLVLVGDSTVADYPASHANRGWGQYLEEHFTRGTVQVINLASPGRSTKTFLQEGRWARALAEKPDVILIQFGHNDSHVRTNPESTDAATHYKDYLRRYIDEARTAGATPVLITPMVRRSFDAQGKIVEPAGANNLLPYVAAMKEVAAEKNAPLIDLYASSKALAEQLGPAEAKKHASKEGDATHFNETGARAIAALVLQSLPAAAPPLKPLLKTP